MNIVNKSKVEYLDHMGDDISVVNAARVSFHKESDYKVIDGELNVSHKDQKLIEYLAKHNHWSPFAHTSIQIRVATPIFVARQLGKHQVGLVWNEVSRRYVDEEPVFYFPDKWRKRAENVKQGSSDENVSLTLQHGFSTEGLVDTPQDLCVDVLNHYKELLRQGVAPEQARMILPQNMMTEFIWTGSLMAFYRVYKQRTDPHAQQEVQEVAKQIGDICQRLFPYSWKALNFEGGE